MGGAAIGGRRIAAAVLLGVAALVAVASARLLLDGRRHLIEAGRFQAAGAHDRARVALEDAARAYLPGSPYPARALDRLALAARAHEMRGEVDKARKSWEIIRRSVLASRHVWQPQADLLQTAELQISRLWAGAIDDAVSDPVARPRDPHPVLSLLLLLGLIVWLGGSATLLGVPDSPGTGFGIRATAWLAMLGGLALWLSMSWLAG
jgi:hypothetical protein